MIRRKACFISFKTLLSYPDCISEIGDLLCDSLKDKESSVQIASVTTILEITRINPKIFVYVLPKLFDLFDTKSNWLLIKILKTVSLIPHHLDTLLHCNRTKNQEKDGSLILETSSEYESKVSGDRND